MADGTPRSADDRDLRAWAARALRFDERAAQAEVDARAERLLDQWCRHYADGDLQRFERRLAWDGLDPDAAGARLAGQRNIALPDWVVWLESMLSATIPPPAVEPSFPADTLWRTWADHGWQRAGLADDHAFHHATGPLRAALAQRLADIAAAALIESAARFAADHPSARHPQWQCWLADTGLRQLLHEHPVLARQLAEAGIDAAATAIELRDRLHADADRRGERFGPEFARMPDTIEATGADRHHHGRQVMRLRFGARDLYYKPRSLAPEALFQRTADLLAEAGVDAAPPTLPLLDCGDYGYAAAAVPCEHELEPAAVARWHRRAGGLLALAWLFNARDLHQDNLIATADGPLPIDLETILQPSLPEGFGAFDRAQASIARSCLASGLLRFAQTAPNGVRSDASGLRGQASATQARWHGLDTLQFERRIEAVGNRLQHRLYAAGRPLDPADHVEAVVDGFRTTLHAIVPLRTGWLAEGGLLQRAAGTPVRVVFRPSQFYADLLQLLATPALQRNGAHSLVAIDRLNRVFSGLSERPRWWALVAAERQQLERGDLPRFTTAADATGFDEHDIDAMFEQSGLSIVRERIGSLDAARIDEQAALLVTALRPTVTTAAEVPVRGDALGRAQALQYAARIIDDVLAAAVHGDDGLVTWLQPEALGRATARGFGGDYYLYHGALGVGWMLAAFHRVQPDQRCADDVDAVLASVSRIADASRVTEWLAAEPCGAAHGLGSLLLGLLAIDRLADDSGAGEVAVRIAAMLRGERIEQESATDLHSGVAGLLLALAALQRRHPAAAHARLAERCVGRLQALVDADGVPLGYDGIARSGAAHGLSGIAFALAHAGHAFARDDWRSAAAALVRIEDRLFDVGQRNWAPAAATAAALNSWCNGATGILLLRAAAGLLRGSEAETLALGALTDAPCAAVDHLCCGVLGRADALGELGRLTARPELIASARQLAGAVAARPAPRLDRALDVRMAAGLFRGGSGVALALLRLHVDSDLPSPLLFGIEPLPC